MQRNLTKKEAKKIRVITLQGVKEKSSKLLSQYWNNEYLIVKHHNYFAFWEHQKYFRRLYDYDKYDTEGLQQNSKIEINHVQHFYRMPIYIP